MLSDNNNHNRAFTLIEIMVAVSIFTIVAVIAVSALLSANAVNQKAQAIKLAMDNLNYALDSITIKMKRGYDFASSASNELTFTSPKMDPLNLAESYAYRLTPSSGGRGVLEMERNNSGNFVAITSDGLDIKSFSVQVEKGVDDTLGRAIISIEGAALVGHQEQNFAVQTTVSERF